MNTHTVPVTTDFYLPLFKGKVHLLYSDIIYIEGFGNYTVFHCNGGSPIITSKSMSYYDSRLPSHILRVHKSFFVNVDFVQEHTKETLLLANGLKVMVARRRKKTVKNILDKNKNLLKNHNSQ